MKLNVGCGGSYKKGYRNIDAFDSSVADQTMSVVNMDFEDDTFTQVDCIQVIEHLGAASSIYALAEIYRVLRPDGSLLLQTPDLVRSFKSFIKGNEDSRKLIMNWIYGLDSPGMSHRYGFPEELLRRVLHETGFEDIEIDYMNSDSVHPSIQARCRKGKSATHQAISHFRRRLVRERLVNLQQQVEVLEIETLVQELVDVLKSSKTALSKNHLSRILETSSTCSPRVGQVFLATISQSGMVKAEEAQRYIEVLQELDSIGFVKVLVHLFMEIPLLLGRQDDTFQSLKAMAERVSEKILSGDQKARESLSHTASEVSIWIENDYFSRTMLQDLSAKALALGIRAFALDRLDEAEGRLIDAIRLNRDSVLAIWNMARVFALRGLTEKSLRCYTSVRNLMLIQYLKQSRQLIKKVEMEISSVKQGNLEITSSPIHSMP